MSQLGAENVIFTVPDPARLGSKVDEIVVRELTADVVNAASITIGDITIGTDILPSGDTSTFAPNTGSPTNVAIVPEQTGAFLLNIPDDTPTGGNARGDNAVDMQMNRTTAAQVASGDHSAIIAGHDNTASGEDSSVLCGNTNTAQGTQSCVIGGTNNATAGAQSCVLAGTTNTAAGGQSIVLGGTNNQVQLPAATASVVVGGTNNTITGCPQSIILGGTANSIAQGAGTPSGCIVAGSNNSVTNSTRAIAIGNNLVVGGAQSITIGSNIENPSADSVLIGKTSYLGYITTVQQVGATPNQGFLAFDGLTFITPIYRQVGNFGLNTTFTFTVSAATVTAPSAGFAIWTYAFPQQVSFVGQLLVVGSTITPGASQSSFLRGTFRGGCDSTNTTGGTNLFDNNTNTGDITPVTSDTVYAGNTATLRLFYPPFVPAGQVVNWHGQLTLCMVYENS